LPERPTDLDARVRLVWKAVTWIQRGKVDPALGLLETLEGPDLDEWSAAVVRERRGCAAEAHHLQAVCRGPRRRGSRLRRVAQATRLAMRSATSRWA
jgi:hypothetical protein